MEGKKKITHQTKDEKKTKEQEENGKNEMEAHQGTIVDLVNT